MSAPQGARRAQARAALACSRVLGVVALAGVVATVWLGLFVTPPDEFMGNLVRLLYVHPPMAWVAFLAFGVASLVEPALPLAEDEGRALRPTRGGLGGGRASSSRVSRSSPGRSGVARPGAPGGYGTRCSRPRHCCSSSTSVTWPCGGCRASSTSGPADRPSQRSSPSSTCPSSTSRSSGGGACTRRQRCSTRRPTRRYVHGSMAWTLLLGFVSFTLVYIWLVAHRYRLARDAGPGGRRGPRGRPCRAQGGGERLMNGYVEAGYVVVLGTLRPTPPPS